MVALSAQVTLSLNDQLSGQLRQIEGRVLALAAAHDELRRVWRHNSAVIVRSLDPLGRALAGVRSPGEDGDTAARPRTNRRATPSTPLDSEPDSADVLGSETSSGLTTPFLPLTSFRRGRVFSGEVARSGGTPGEAVSGGVEPAPERVGEVASEGAVAAGVADLWLALARWQANAAAWFAALRDGRTGLLQFTEALTDFQRRLQRVSAGAAILGRGVDIRTDREGLGRTETPRPAPGEALLLPRASSFAGIAPDGGFLGRVLGESQTLLPASSAEEIARATASRGSVPVDSALARRASDGDLRASRVIVEPAQADRERSFSGDSVSQGGVVAASGGSFAGSTIAGGALALQEALRGVASALGETAQLAALQGDRLRALWRRWGIEWESIVTRMATAWRRLEAETAAPSRVVLGSEGLPATAAESLSPSLASGDSVIGSTRRRLGFAERGPGSIAERVALRAGIRPSERLRTPSIAREEGSLAPSHTTNVYIDASGMDADSKQQLINDTLAQVAAQLNSDYAFQEG